MIGTVFSRNGELLPLGQGMIPVDDVNFAYGYGVYETLKIRGGVLYFSELHVDRLLHSAAIIGLEHGFDKAIVLGWLAELVIRNQVKDANLKVLLIGRNGPGADLYMMELNPLYPKRPDYRDGATATLFAGERQYPQAKSLNMLTSTMAFRQARAHDAYDAILVNRYERLTEGTRTNLFYTDGTVFFTPPAEEVLAGVTRLTVKQCIHEAGWRVEERSLDLTSVRDGSGSCQGLFLTSTSTKIMPISRIVTDGLAISGSGTSEEFLDIHLTIPDCVRELMNAYGHWLDNWHKSQKPLVE